MVSNTISKSYQIINNKFRNMISKFINLSTPAKIITSIAVVETIHLPVIMYLGIENTSDIEETKKNQIDTKKINPTKSNPTDHISYIFLNAIKNEDLDIVKYYLQNYNWNNNNFNQLHVLTSALKLAKLNGHDEIYKELLSTTLSLAHVDNELYNTLFSMLAHNIIESS